MTHQREHWGSRLGFVLAAAGSAIGLGSLWKFPYVTGQNGGGAFVLVYVICTLVVCFPLFISELIIGRSTQRATVGAFVHLSPERKSWKGVGWLAVFTTLVVFSYYAVVAGWTLNYTLLSLTGCCRGRSAEEIGNIFNVLDASGDVVLLWQILFLLLTIGVVYGGVRKGIEYWARILMPLLLILLLALFLFSLTLPGFGKAARFVLYPDFDQLTPSGVLSALGLAFFTASLGFGIILTYGSYMRPQDDIPKTGLAVLVLTMVISVVASLTIFPIIFTFDLPPSEGPGLVFKTLPVLFAQLPATLIISTAFFVLLVFTALTSTVSLLENLVANAIEVFGWSRHRSALLTSLLVFVVGVPSALAGSGWLFPSWTEMYGENFFATISTIWDRWFLPIVGLLTSLFVGWVMDRRVRNQEFLKGARWHWFLGLWIFLVRWIVPLAILLLLLEGTGIIEL